MNASLKFLPLLLALASTSLAISQSTPPWSKGKNDPAGQQGYVFLVPDVDNVPDLHGNPSDAKLVIFIGGNQFFVLPQLITAFEHHHPELKGHIFYETLPPGILRKQIAADDAITLGNLTIQVRPDVYEAGPRELSEMEQHGQIKGVVQYATNNLEIMVPVGNPKGIQSLKDLKSGALAVVPLAILFRNLALQDQQAMTANGGADPYPIPWLDKNGSHNQPAGPNLEPSHIYHFKGLGR